MSEKQDVPTFAGKPMELQEDGSGWRLKFNDIDVRVSYAIDVRTWRAIVWIHGRQIAACDFASSAAKAAAQVEMSIRETAATMNAAVAQ